MMLLAKAALGMGGAVALAGAYTFHEGLIRVDVDEYRAGGSHVHMWVPAAAVPMAMYLVPRETLRRACKDGHEALPAVRAMAKELGKLPDVDLVEVKDGEQHIQIRTRNGRMQVDVDAPDQSVHVRVPLSTIDDVARELEASGPGA